MYEPGDCLIIDGNVLEVDSNHCGFPWPVSIDGCFYGVVVVHYGKTIYCDALSGKVLSEDELSLRKNNEEYDYEFRTRENKGRRYKYNYPKEIIRNWNWFERFFYYNIYYKFKLYKYGKDYSQIKKPQIKVKDKLKKMIFGIDKRELDLV